LAGAFILPTPRYSGETAFLPRFPAPFPLLAFTPTRHYTRRWCWAAARSAGIRRGAMDLPKCQKCNNGILIPLSDYGQEGSSVFFKAWVCTNPECGFSLRVDKGEVSYGKKVEHKH
jgi:hypothetical protein